MRPPSVEAAVASVAAITGAGHALTVRGGGHSYTGGYGPTRPGTVVLDMSALDRVVEINEADGWVTAEAGCTWRTLHDALAPVGRRTPFFGPLSGIVATVGGAAAQNAAFFGSARHGPMSESVLGLDVATADGALMRLGRVGETGFARDFGPEAVGLFLGDCGAFGVKVRVTMKLVPVPEAVRFASFAFESFGAVIDAQIALSGVDAIAESYGFDAETHENLRRAGFTFGEGATALRDVAQAEGGRASGIAAAIRTAAGVRRAVSETRNSLHLVIEGANDSVVAAATEEIADRTGRLGGTELPDTIPRITRSRPFRPLKALLGPAGEAWLPIHGLLSLFSCPRRSAGSRRLPRGPRGRDAYPRNPRRPAHHYGRRPPAAWNRSFSGRTRFRPSICAPSPTRRERSTRIDRPERRRVRGCTPCARHWSRCWRPAVPPTTRSAPIIRIWSGSIRARRALIETVKRALDPRNLMSPGALGL